ncbi:hypothetical protein ACFLZI_01920 [Nitrospirota bacterium]
MEEVKPQREYFSFIAGSIGLGQLVTTPLIFLYAFSSIVTEVTDSGLVLIHVIYILTAFCGVCFALVGLRRKEKNKMAAIVGLLLSFMFFLFWIAFLLNLLSYF